MNELLNRNDVLLIGFDPVPEIDGALLATEYSAALEPNGVFVLSVAGERQAWLIATDPDDGYRSTLEPKQIPEPAGLLLQFQHEPIPVRVSRPSRIKRVGWTESGDYITLTDEGGHTWLTFGTSDHKGWYPCAVCTWQPKAAL
jgi:hypothetical protein